MAAPTPQLSQLLAMLRNARDPWSRLKLVATGARALARLTPAQRRDLLRTLGLEGAEELAELAAGGDPQTTAALEGALQRLEADPSRVQRIGREIADSRTRRKTLSGLAAHLIEAATAPSAAPSGSAGSPPAVPPAAAAAAGAVEAAPRSAPPGPPRPPPPPRPPTAGGKARASPSGAGSAAPGPARGPASPARTASPPAAASRAATAKVGQPVTAPPAAPAGPPVAAPPPLTRRERRERALKQAPDPPAAPSTAGAAAGVAGPAPTAPREGVAGQPTPPLMPTFAQTVSWDAARETIALSSVQPHAGATAGNPLRWLRGLRQELAAGRRPSTAALATLLQKELAPDWARRRALAAAFAHGLPTQLDDALLLVEQLASPAARAWALGDLAASRRWSDEEWRTLVDRAETTTLRRRLEARRLS